MEEWITTMEAARLSQYHPEHIRELARENKIEARKFGPVWQVKKESLMLYLQKMKEQGEKRGPRSES